MSDDDDVDVSLFLTEEMLAYCLPLRLMVQSLLDG